tara:strand:- start:368 stop:838 length:471 start_codon:yes stop_codon:yes gene_type:complete
MPTTLQKSTKDNIKIRTTNTKLANESNLDGSIFDPLPNVRILKFFTIKGRIEYKKDCKGVIWAISQTPGIDEVHFEDGEISISWCINRSFLTELESISYAKEYLKDFIRNLNKVDSEKYFDDLGIEVHVFTSSLKPIDEYDGERNGPFIDEPFMNL